MTRISNDGDSQLRGIIFAEDFDVYDESPSRRAAVELRAKISPPDEQPPAQMYSQADVQAAIENDRIQLRGELLEEFERTQRSCNTKSLAAIAEQLVQVRGEVEQHAERAAAAAGRLFLQSLTTLLPAVCEFNNVRETVGLVQRLLADLNHRPTLQIQVTASAVRAVSEALNELPGGTACKLNVVADGKLRPGDAVVSWEHGVVTRSGTRIQEALVQALRQFDLLPLDDASEPADSLQRSPSAASAERPEPAPLEKHRKLETINAR